MGLYDSVNVACPRCKDVHEIQSKAGECLLRTYPLYEVPLVIAEDITGEEIYCECGEIFLIQPVVSIVKTIAMTTVPTTINY